MQWSQSFAFFCLLLLVGMTGFSGLSPILIRIALERQPFMMICFFLLILLCSFLLYIWLISLAASPGSLLNFGLILWLKCTWPKGLIFSAQARHVTVCTVQACLLHLHNMTYVWMSVCLSVCMYVYKRRESISRERYQRVQCLASIVGSTLSLAEGNAPVAIGIHASHGSMTQIVAPIAPCFAPHAIHLPGIDIAIRVDWDQQCEEEVLQHALHSSACILH